jgi:predicted secreted protein
VKKISVAIMALICFAMISGSCAANVSDKNYSQINQVSPFHHDKIIYLPSNPSAGFAWAAKYDSSKVALIRHNFIKTSPLIGAPGMEIFEFKGIKGQKIVMEYIHPWDHSKIYKKLTFYI